MKKKIKYTNTKIRNELNKLDLSTTTITVKNIIRISGSHKEPDTLDISNSYSIFNIIEKHTNKVLPYVLNIHVREVGLIPLRRNEFEIN